MHKMGRGMVAHDVMTALHIYFGDASIAHFRLSRDDFANMDDHSRGGTAHARNLYFPAPLFLSPQILRIWGETEGGERADISCIIHLTAGLDVKARFGNDDL